MTSVEDPALEVPGGNSPNADGVGGDKGTVSHDTYKKTMDQLKSVQSQLREFTKEKETREYNDRLAKDQHTQIIEEQKSKILELEAENNGHKQNILDTRKLHSALGLLHESGIQLEGQYYGMLQLDQIVVDESGRPDKTSVAKVVSDFKKQHPRLVMPAKNILPNDRPAGTVQPISIEAWKKLPPKEQKEALASGNVEKWKRQ